MHAAAQRLQKFGLAWDGSRLLGQAAAHSSDRRVVSSLLQAARALQDPPRRDDHAEPDDATARATTPHPADAARQPVHQFSDVLSARERDVAALLLQQRTYREIGAELYISAKTVEHHVARIKQRIGTSGRSELLARLRALADERTAP